MWTIRYKNAWIHGYCAKDECQIQRGGMINGVWQNYTFQTVKSLRVAKETIRRKLKENC